MEMLNTVEINPEALGEADALPLARSYVYAFLARALSDPHASETSLSLTGTAASRLVAAAALVETEAGRLGLPAEASAQAGEPIELAAGEILSEAPGDEAWREEYDRIFGHILPKDVPPCELEYAGGKDVFAQTQKLADIAGFYSAFGLDRSAVFRDRVDHVVLESEFLAYLNGRLVAARALGHGRENIRILEEAEAKFFAEHFGRWVDRFGACLIAVAGARGRLAVYRRIGMFLSGWVRAERRIRGLAAGENPFVPPDPPVETAEGGCAACDLA